MDPRKQPGWKRLAAPGKPLDSYLHGQAVWIYTGAGWTSGTVEAVQQCPGYFRVCVKCDAAHKGFVMAYDDRNICPKNP